MPQAIADKCSRVSSDLAHVVRLIQTACSISRATHTFATVGGLLFWQTKDLARFWNRSESVLREVSGPAVTFQAVALAVQIWSAIKSNSDGKLVKEARSFPALRETDIILSLPGLVLTDFGQLVRKLTDSSRLLDTRLPCVREFCSAFGSARLFR